MLVYYVDDCISSFIVVSTILSTQLLSSAEHCTSGVEPSILEMRGRSCHSPNEGYPNWNPGGTLPGGSVGFFLLRISLDKEAKARLQQNLDSLGSFPLPSQLS